jgi:multiple sugar transport system substrate-binding protein
VPSIKDVAYHCGVSYATVSNVINNKGNVSEETCRKVEEAIKALNYIPHAGARTLKGQLQNVIGVIFPSINDPYLARLYMGIQESLSINNNYMINLIITDDVSSIENKGLNDLLQQSIAGIILMTCQPDNSEAFRLLEQKHIPVVLVDRYVPIKIANFVSFDYKSIGKYLCDLLLNRYERLGLITGPSSYSSEKDLIEGFYSGYRERGKNIDELIIVKSVYNRFGAFRAMIELLNYEYGQQLPEVIVTSNKILYDGVREALIMQGANGKKNIGILTLEEENWLEAVNTEKITTVYRPAKRLGTLASELLLENINAQKIHTPKTKILHFYELAPEPNKQPGVKIESSSVVVKKKLGLTLLMLRDNSTWAIKSLIPNFKNGFGKDINVEIREYEYEELYNRIIESKRKTSKEVPDILMLDNFWFPYLAKNGYLVELSTLFDDEEDIRRGFIPEVFETYSMYKGKYFALPFNFIVQLLFYRKDLFLDDRLKRQFLKMYGVELSVPKTWDEYNAIAEFFTKRYNSSSPIEYGNTATAATSTICDYLPRMWAYGGSIFDRNGNITIDTNEALQALKSYIRCFDYAPPEAIDQWYWPEVDMFAKGNAAMMIIFIAHTARLIDLEYSAVAGKFGVSELPGGYPVRSGWALGISTGSEVKEIAFEFIRWASSSRISIPYSILGGCTPRSSLNQTEELLNLYPYFSFAEEQFLKSRKRTYPFEELIGLGLSERDFEVIMHRYITKAIKEEQTPEEALFEAQMEIEKHRVQ